MGSATAAAAQEDDAPPMTQGLLALGVLTCFCVSSVTQESLTRTRDDGTRFGSESVLVLLQSIGATFVAAMAMLYTRLTRATPTKKQLEDEKKRRGEAPGARSWAIVVAAYYASHWCGLASLRHLSYPVHVTFKSCKAIPVVIGERLLTSKRHSLAKKLGVVIMCVGVTVFLLGGTGHHKESNATTLFGVGLVTLALFFDGVYAGMQQRLVNTSSEFELMMHMNGWQGVLALIACLSSSELANARAYAATHDGLYTELAAYTASKAAGTLCIYRLLRESGTLVVATVTTLRKVLSVLLSVLTFGHALSAPQMAALGAIFAHKYIGDAIAKPLALRPPKKQA